MRLIEYRTIRMTEDIMSLDESVLPSIWKMSTLELIVSRVKQTMH